MHRKSSKKRETLNSQQWWKTGHFGSGSCVIPMSKKVYSPKVMKKKCERSVGRNKYERDAPEIRQYWLKLFDVLEDDANISIDQRKEVLQEHFDYYKIRKLENILGTRERQFRGDEVKTPVNEDEKKKHKMWVKREGGEKNSGDSSDYDLFTLPSSSSPLVGTDRTIPASKQSSIPILEDLRDRSKKVDCVLDMRSTQEDVKQNVSKCKMYRDFFKRKPGREAVWRSLPPIATEDMYLRQKADAVTGKIAKEFIDWLEELGGEEEFSYNVDNIVNMFDIGLDYTFAKTLKVDVKELASVPRRVAEAEHVPQFGRRGVLKREIKRDLRASHRKSTYTAFGRQLPFEMQARPPAERYFKKWTTCEQIPEKVASMATVWEGIENLRSTEAFCEFLKTNKPEMKPPEYLQQCGMMTAKHQHTQPRDNVSLLLDN